MRKKIVVSRRAPIRLFCPQFFRESSKSEQRFLTTVGMMRLPIASVMEGPMLTNTSPFGLDDVVLNAEILRRPSRRPDYEAENNALKALANTMVESPQTIL